MTHANPELRQKVAKDVQEMADLAGVPLVESAVISMDSTRQNESSYQAVLDPEVFRGKNFAS